MDFFGFPFTPAAVWELLALGVGSGAGIGAFFVVVTLFYRHSR